MHGITGTYGAVPVYSTDTARDLRLRARAKGTDLIEWSRYNINVFSQYCFPVEQQPLHVRWQDLCSKHQYLVLWSPPEHGKTWQLGFLRMLWELGRNPGACFAHFSGTADIPEANLQQIVKHLRFNLRLRSVFPHLQIQDFKRTKGNVLALWLKRPRASLSRDPSLSAMGILGQILGRRLDGILLDDILDQDNTYTRASREKVNARVEDEVLSRPSANCWVRYIGHPWYRDDTGHKLAAKPAYHHVRYDVECDPDGRPGPPALWPKPWVDPESKERVLGWPWARIVAKRDNTPAVTWHRVWRCRTPSEDVELFPYSLLQLAAQRGQRLSLGRPSPEAATPVTGVDLSTGDGSDLTILCTGYTLAGQGQLLDIRGGLWDDARLYKEMRSLLRLYPEHGGFLVEDNGFQRLIHRTLARPEVMRAYGWRQEELDRMRIRGHTTTGKSKADATVGIHGLAIDFQAGTVALASDAQGKPWPQVDALMQGLQDYDPSQPTRHTSDYVIAYWLCREMQRKLGQLRQEGRVLIS